ncbi:MAG: adenosylcobinamide-GDP ribazoletransferase [Euryarchaeota archaeon]|nr:adenosylcobinamide-GDP ribazoletransferase [Euryarchaeota archaeon]
MLEPKRHERWRYIVVRILGLLSFSTILPLNIHTTIEEIASFTYLWPLIGGLIGVFVGGVGFLFLEIIHLPQLVVSAVIYSFAISFTGFHHLDGLIDFGDGIMAHGDPKRKIDVMRDSRIGTGGISLFFIVAIITLTSINSIPSNLLFYILFVSEIAAKTGILSCCTVSMPLSDGTGRFFIKSMNMKIMVVSLIITFILGFLAINVVGILGITGGVIGGILTATIARRNFRSATGDVLGASNEISRMVSLLIMIASVVSWKLMF